MPLIAPAQNESGKTGGTMFFPGQSRVWIPILSAAVATTALPEVSLASGETGACCLTCEPCEILTQEDCLARDGHYEGDGTTCDDCPIFDDWPDPAFCEADPADDLGGLFLSPSQPGPVDATFLSVLVASSCGPFEGASVVVTLVQPSSTFCNGGSVLTGTTNAAGRVTLLLDGSGCVDDVPEAVVIKANGLTIRLFENAKSPDSDRSGIVDLGDLVEFSNEFLDVAPSTCHDYDNNEDTDLSDLLLFSRPFSQGNHCP